MRSGLRFLSAVMVAGVLASPAVISGCYHHHYYSETWGESEGPYYSRWEVETRREHREWAQRSQEDQRAYWQWRRDHDHDHD